MASTQEKAPAQIAQALVEFTLRGAFPEEAVSSLKIGPEELSPAIQALAEAKAKLRVRLVSQSKTSFFDILTLT